jgi:hypothetical protein
MPISGQSEFVEPRFRRLDSRFPESNQGREDGFVSLVEVVNRRIEIDEFKPFLKSSHASRFPSRSCHFLTPFAEMPGEELLLAGHSETAVDDSSCVIGEP